MNIGFYHDERFLCYHFEKTENNELRDDFRWIADSKCQATLMDGRTIWFFVMQKQKLPVKSPDIVHQENIRME